MISKTILHITLAMGLLATGLFAKDAPQTLPGINLSNVDGKSVSSTEWKGKVVLVDFWATWCVACREAFPILSNLQDKYGERLIVVGISTDQQGGGAKVGKFAKKSKLNYLVLLDPEDTQSKVFGFESVPSLYVYGTDGKFLAYYQGLGEDNQKALETLLAKTIK